MVLRGLFQSSKSLYNFCKVESYTIKPQNTVIDYKTLTYNPSKKVKFDSTNKSLLYYYKPLIWTYQTQYWAYLSPMVLLGYIIKHNPFYTTFPAALPIMFVAEFWLFLRWFKKFKYLRYVVSEVYLLQDGQTIEVVYQKKFWRKVKEQNTTQVFYVTNLKTVVTDEKKPLKGNLFPQTWPLDKNVIKKTRWSFIKYYLNQNNFLVFPINANYLNAEILIAVMNGKIINTSKQYIEQIEGSMLEQAQEGQLKSDSFI